MDEIAQSACELCGGTGWQLIVEDKVSRARRCSCSRPQSGEKSIASARIPPRYLACEFDNYFPKSHNQEITKNKAIEFASDYPNLEDEFRGGSLLFTGISGSGKTHMATAVLKELLKKGFSGLFVDFHELLSEIRNTYDELSQTSELDVLRPILGVDVLLLDDLGSQRMTDWVKDTVFHIINLRYNKNRTLLITTNLALEPSEGRKRHNMDAVEKRLTADTLQDRLGYPVVSRLYEMCTSFECTWYDKGGEKYFDYRKEVKKAGSEMLGSRKGSQKPE